MEERRPIGRTIFWIIVSGAALWFLTPPIVRFAMDTTYDLGMDEDTRVARKLGRVRQGKFIPLEDEETLPFPMDLTAIHMVEARSPESEQIDLGDLEGHLLVVSGFYESDWIYKAHIDKDLGYVGWAQIVMWSWSR